MKKGRIPIILGLLLIAAALLLTGYNLLISDRAAKASEQVLSQLLPQISDDPIPEGGRSVYDDPEMAAKHPKEVEYPDYLINPEMAMPVRTVEGKDYVGVLDLPSLSLQLPVLDKCSYSNLQTAPCRYAGTAYLDDLVICAHNYDRHFGQIKNLHLGDTVIFTDMDGNVFEYTVTEIYPVRPTAVEDVISGESDLVLYTCTLGGANRVTVRCDRIEESGK